jgi:tetratricopeptide (TPR) repeat protein
VTTLERAAAAAPNEYRIRGNLGDAYRAAGFPTKAAEAYALSIALALEQLRVNPRDADALSLLATGLAKSGRTAEAAEPMGKALALDSEDHNFLVDGAVVAALSDRDAEALDRLRKAVAAGACPAVIAWQPEFHRFRGKPEFRAIIAAPRSAAGS